MFLRLTEIKAGTFADLTALDTEDRRIGFNEEKMEIMITLIVSLMSCFPLTQLDLNCWWQRMVQGRRENNNSSILLFTIKIVAVTSGGRTFFHFSEKLLVSKATFFSHDSRVIVLVCVQLMSRWSALIQSRTIKLTGSPLLLKCCDLCEWNCDQRSRNKAISNKVTMVTFGFRSHSLPPHLVPHPWSDRGLHVSLICIKITAIIVFCFKSRFLQTSSSWLSFFLPKVSKVSKSIATAAKVY